MLECINKAARKRFDMVDEDEPKRDSYSSRSMSIERKSIDYNLDRTSLFSSPHTPTSVLPHTPTARSAGAHGVMLGRAAFYNPWQSLGHVDILVYGDAPSGITRRKALEVFQVYGDSVLGMHGNNRPNIRDVFKPVLNFFHSEPGNAIWKRNVDAAFHECGTVKSLLEETLGAIPD